jgi:hypothetical protein
VYALLQSPILESMPTFDIKSLTSWIPLVAAGSAMAGGWALHGYRLTALEVQQEKIAEKLDALDEMNESRGEEVKCLICDAHGFQCPGC